MRSLPRLAWSPPPWLLGAVLAVAAGPPVAAEQRARAEAADIEEVVVVARTGSRIKRQAASPSPLTEVGADDLRVRATKDLRDLVDILSINNGAENNSDNLTQNFTAGTANVNLRGLGVSSTLVLLNGKRQVFSAAPTDDGASFVDLAALVPVLAVERVEVLKDGASAIYGSDAVAGVANFLTRRGFDGLELQVEYRRRTGNGSQSDLNVDGVFGGAVGDGGSFLLAASYLDRSSLLLGEVDWLRPATSGFGNPGSFHVPSLGRTVADPGCGENGGLLQTLAGGGAICRFDYGPQITAVPVESRLQGYARADWPVRPGVWLWAEAGYARNDVSREVSPSFPVLNTPLVPVDNPGNVFGEDVLFQGRPFGVGHPPEVNYYQHNTVRVAFGAEGAFGAGFGWDVAYIRAANDALLNPRDVIAANFQAALRGFGGAGCDTSPNAATPARPGAGECRYFNPFSSAFGAAPGAATFNDPRLRDFIIGDYLGDAESEMQVLDANVTGFFGDLGGGPIGFAAGLQLREESLGTNYDSITTQDGFAFLIGNPNFAGGTNVRAAYGELALPLTRSAEVIAALRYEDYGGGVGHTWDPKVMLLFAPTPAWSLRASVGTSFRAPSTFQTQGAQTNFVNILDHDGSRTFAGRRTVGNPQLRPETSTAFNMGATWRPRPRPRRNLEFGVDVWDYSFQDVLRKDNAQAIVSADPFDARVRRTSAGTIAIVNVAFINADAIDTRGIDFSARASFATAWGDLAPFVEGTVILRYDVTNAGRRRDGLGRLNRGNVGAPNQAFKANVGLRFSRGVASANLLLRHVGAYEDDSGGAINAFATWDANVGVDLGAALGRGTGTTLRFGVVNFTDADPPFVNVAGSYDVRSADPRGRRAFARLEVRLGLPR